MISGYLEKAYGYSESDASVLSEFVTYYNAVFRNDFEYIRGRYAEAVLKHLSPEKTGLSTRYQDWPGKSQILIPITEEATGKASLSSLDSGELTHEKVIEDLKKEVTKGIEPRKEITELKEKALEEEQKKIEKEKEVISEKLTQIQTEKKLISEEKKAAEEKLADKGEDKGL